MKNTSSSECLFETPQTSCFAQCLHWIELPSIAQADEHPPVSGIIPPMFINRSWVLSLIKYCYFVKDHYWFFDFFLILWESHMKTLLYCAVPFENWLQVSAFRSAKECSTASTYIAVSFMLCWLSNKKGGLQGTVWPNNASVLFLFCHPSAFLQELKETQSFFLFFSFFFLVYQIVLKQCWHWLNLLQIQSLTNQLNGSPEVL